MAKHFAQNEPPGQAAVEKSRAAMSSVIWSAFLTVLKIVSALASNSLGILSEALHSALDFVAAAITWVAVKISAMPPDANQPFGHGKVENLSALGEAVLLVVTALWIIVESLERLFFNAKEVDPSWWVMAVVIISLAVDVNRSAMLRLVAKKHKSQALEADALHFTTDIWSSAVVLAGLLCVLGGRLLPAGGFLRAALEKADSAAALGVAAIIIKVSWDLIKRSVNSLMDAGSEKEVRELRRALAHFAPGYTYSRVRVRYSGARYFADLVVETPPNQRVDVTHGVTAMLESVVEQVLPGAEISICLEPSARDGDRDLLAACHRLAAEHGLDIHNLFLSAMSDGLHVFVHIEMEPDMHLEKAHAVVSAFEADLSRRIGAVHIVSHIEPKKSPEQAGSVKEASRGSGELLAVLHETMVTYPKLCDCHEELVITTGNDTSLSFRCKIKHKTNVAGAHQTASMLETDLRRRLPGLGRITIHIEPL